MKFQFSLLDEPGSTHWIVEAKAAYDVEVWARGLYRGKRYTIKLAPDDTKAAEVIPSVPTERERHLEHAASLMRTARAEGYQQALDELHASLRFYHNKGFTKAKAKSAIDILRRRGPLK